jgi:hypothetical protein
MTPRELLGLEQLGSMLTTAKGPLRIQVDDGDGGIARLLEMLCGGAPGTDGYTRAQVGEIEIAARRGR